MERFTHSICPICGSHELQLDLHLKDHSISGEEFDIFSCGNCGFRFTQNAPSEQEIAPYYQSEDYISHSNTKKGFVNRAYHIVRNIMLGRKHKLVKRLTQGKRLLDMGCGTGYFLNYMKENGYNVKGVEIDEGARNFGQQQFGVDIVAPDEMMTGSTDEVFDVITLWHVLEHIYELDAYVTRLKELLHDDGHLIIAVPNRSSVDASHYGPFWAAYDVPIHLWHFTPDTLTRLAEKHGLELIEINSLPFDPFYISMLSSKYRGDGLSLMKGAWIGFKSFLKGSANPKKASSPVYVLKKAA